MSSILRQLRAAYPPKPAFTEKNVGDLTGKAYIVTGSNTGIGKELARILYSKGGKVYVAARSEEKANAAIASIKARHPDAKGGELVFLKLDLGDLATIKSSAEEFLRREKQLHVLFNNAGVMVPPQGSKTAQGYELQLGTNCVGPFLFTKLLTPILVSTAAAATTAPGGTGTVVRVVWVSSSAAELLSPRPIDAMLDNLDYHDDKPAGHKYGVSKAGNYLHACEFARRFGKEGVVSVALNPGNLTTDLARHRGRLENAVLHLLITHPPVNGAYTELFAGLSPDVDMEKSGAWIQPWGRFEPIREDLATAAKPESEGGTGAGEKFWRWSEEQVKSYL